MAAQDNNINGNATETIKENGHSTKGNEDKKIFVGGISPDVNNEDLSKHFSQFGEVSQAQVKYDRTNGRSRGFAFVEFVASEGCKLALAAREQTIKNKSVEVKPAKSRENKKVFVGGLPSDFKDTELRAHFEQFGKVDDIEWPFDKQTKTRRNFAFIVFEEEESAVKASSQAKQVFGGRECDVKKAVPQGKRFNGANGRMNGARMYGARVAQSPWYNGWNQLVPYGGAAAYGAAGDWFYYGQQQHHQNGAANNANFPNNYQRANGGFDYQQGPAGRQNANANGQRFPQPAQQPQQF